MDELKKTYMDHKMYETALELLQDYFQKDKNIMKVVGGRIRERRKQKGFTQEEVARLMGYKSRSSINKIEMGVTCLNREGLNKISDILETRLSDILGVREFVKKIPYNQMQLINLPGQREITEYNPDNVYHVFRCEDNAMLESGISCGDFVCVLLKDEIKPGNIIAIRIDGKITFRRVFQYDDHFVYKADNPQYASVVQWENEPYVHEILGKAVCKMGIVE